MRRLVPKPSARRYLVRLAFVLCSLATLALCVAGWHTISQHCYARRGVLARFEMPLVLPADGLYGINVSLEQYALSADMRGALELARACGFQWVRQHFAWAEIEPQPGTYDWEPWDRIVSEVTQQGLQLIAVLDTSPPWARHTDDGDNRFAPPQYVTTYGLFVRAFARRYGQQVTCYEIWDEPNIYPHWGARAVDPAGYVCLLRVAAAELRAADRDAVVVSAGLAPTSESGGRNMSEDLFLRGMYAAGARGLFDVVGAKPYGFWSGPEDRRVDAQVLNLSRLILLREEMVRQGDGSLPIFGVAFGWNSLPDGWRGDPPPWGTDSLARQADRTTRALVRIRQEWPWLRVLCWAELQPDVPLDDPRWGFALLDRQGEPTPWYAVLQQALLAPLAGQPLDDTGYYVRLALLGAVSLCMVFCLWRLGTRLPWRDWTLSLYTRYIGSPQWLQWCLVATALAAYYLLPWTFPSLLASGCAGLLILARPDIGLACLVFSVPFFLYPKHLLGKAFSMVETLTVLCTGAYLVKRLWRELHQRSRAALLASLSSSASLWLHSLSSLDWAVAAFVVLAMASLLVSSNLGVSIRELRVIIVEPVLLYFLLRQSHLQEQQMMRLCDALLLAGVVVSAIGLYQYVVSDDVIVAEGVRRMRAVYASPNNLSLLLGRIIPLAVSVFWAGAGRRRVAYGLAVVPLLLSLFLTFSRGGWLVGLPAGLLTIGLVRGRRAALLSLGLIAVCALLLVPALGTERLLSLLDLQRGTSFYRLKLWQAAVEMIRDYPLTGVGLDNFLYRYPEYMLPEAWQEPDLSHPHNIVLDFWTRLGIWGVVVLVWLVVGFFQLARRRYGRLPEGNGRAIILGLTAGMAAALAHGLIDHAYFLVDLAFLFFLALGMMRAWPLLPGTAAGAAAAAKRVTR